MSWRRSSSDTNEKPTVDPSVLDEIKAAISGAKVGDRAGYETRPKRDLRSVTGSRLPTKPNTSYSNAVGAGINPKHDLDHETKKPSSTSLAKLRGLAEAQALEEHTKLKAELYDKVQKGNVVLDTNESSRGSITHIEQGTYGNVGLNEDYDSEDEETDVKAMHQLDTHLAEQRKKFEAGSRSSGMSRNANLKMQRSSDWDSQNNVDEHHDNKQRDYEATAVVSASDLRKLREDRSREIFETLRKQYTEGQAFTKSAIVNPEANLEKVIKIRFHSSELGNTASDDKAVDAGLGMKRHRDRKRHERRNWEDPQDDSENDEDDGGIDRVRNTNTAHCASTDYQIDKYTDQHRTRSDVGRDESKTVQNANKRPQLDLHDTKSVQKRIHNGNQIQTDQTNASIADANTIDVETATNEFFRQLSESTSKC